MMNGNCAEIFLGAFVFVVRERLEITAIMRIINAFPGAFAMPRCWRLQGWGHTLLWGRAGGTMDDSPDLLGEGTRLDLGIRFWLVR